MRRLARHRLIVVLAALACGGALLLGLGLWGLQNANLATHNPDPLIPSAVVTFSDPSPDETPPTKECDDYRVPADEPRHIDVPDIGVAGCILRVGVDQNGSIAVPSNVHVAGWFVDSVLPGEKGVSIIDGHVSGVYGGAIFSALADLVPGDQVIVELGTGLTREFVVVSVDTYSVAETAAEQFRQLEGVDRQLTLITCGGAFDHTTRLYDDRVVVRASALP